MKKKKRFLLFIFLPVLVLLLLFLGKEMYSTTKNMDKLVGTNEYGEPLYTYRFELKGESYVPAGVSAGYGASYPKNIEKKIARNIDRNQENFFTTLDIFHFFHSEESVYKIKNYSEKDVLIVGHYAVMSWLYTLYVNEKMEVLPISFYEKKEAYGEAEEKYELTYNKHRSMSFQGKNYFYVGRLSEDPRKKKLVEERPVDKEKELYFPKFIGENQWLVQKEKEQWNLYCLVPEKLKEVPVKLYLMAG